MSPPRSEQGAAGGWVLTQVPTQRPSQCLGTPQSSAERLLHTLLSVFLCAHISHTNEEGSNTQKAPRLQTYIFIHI